VGLPATSRAPSRVGFGGAPGLGRVSAQALATNPERMQRVQALMRRTVPAVTALTRWTLGRQSRLLALLA
jgi:hypothetical protein